MSDRVYKYQLVESDFEKTLPPIKKHRVKEYSPTVELINFNDNLSKVALLLTTSDKCKNSTISFEKTDYQLFSDMSKTIYHPFFEKDFQLEDMTNTFYYVLIEQSIVCIVSSWEYYFSAIIEKIFNDDLFIKKMLSDREVAFKFLKNYKLFNEFEHVRFCNNDSTSELKIDDFSLGTYMIEKRKVNCQELDDAKYILKNLFGCDIFQMFPNEWTSITELFKMRHSIIHRLDTDKIERYNKDKILSDVEIISEIIHKVDKHLFTCSSSMRL